MSRKNKRVVHGTEMEADAWAIAPRQLWGGPVYTRNDLLAAYDTGDIKRGDHRGHRPVVIVSTERFNRLTSCPIILPITNGGGLACRMGFAVPLKDTKTTGVVRCDQPSALDVTARNGRHIESLPAALMDEVLAAAAERFE